MFTIPQDSVDFILESHYALGRLYEISDKSKKLVRDILTIISTRKGSLIHKPNRGTILYDVKFSPLTDELLDQIQHDIENELRVFNINAKVTAERVEKKSVLLKIDVSLHANNILTIQLITDGSVYKIQELKEIFTKIVIKG